MRPASVLPPLLLLAALAAGCPHDAPAAGHTRGTHEGEAVKTTTRREEEDVVVTATAPALKGTSPQPLRIEVHLRNQGEHRLMVRADEFTLVSSPADTQAGRMPGRADAGAAPDTPLPPGASITLPLVFEDVQPSSETLTLDVFLHDAASGERVATVAVPVDATR